MTPLASTSSSLDLMASSWSVVTRADAANWALAWSSVLDTSAWMETRERWERDGSENMWVWAKDLTALLKCMKVQKTTELGTLAAKPELSQWH